MIGEKSELRAGSTQPAFLSRMKHELFTPLNAIIGYCEMLIEDARDLGKDSFVSDLQKIHAAGKKAHALIEEIVNSGRMEAGTTGLDPEASRMSSLNQNVVAAIGPLEAENKALKAERGSLLVVDDNEANRDLLSHRLERQGYTVSVAENGRQALEMMKAQNFELVLLDIMLPEMDGYQVLEYLRADDTLRHIPVIVISSLDEMDSVVRCIEMGAEDYLPKPFNPVLLKARIGACLEKKRLRERENERIKQELARARDIQLGLLPMLPPLVEGYDLIGLSLPCFEVGGDYFDFIWLGNGNLGVALGDVSGKGLDAAMLMCSLHANLRAQVQTHAAVPEIIAAVNGYIYENTPPDKFATLFYGVLDPQNHLLSYTNAGHNPPIFVRSDGTLEALEAHGIPIGMFRNVGCELGQIRFEPGDLLIIYSDGLTESTNERGEEFGVACLLDHVWTNRHLRPSELRDGIGEAISRFVGKAHQSDDMTLVIIKRIQA